MKLEDGEGTGLIWFLIFFLCFLSHKSSHALAHYPKTSYTIKKIREYPLATHTTTWVIPKEIFDKCVSGGLHVGNNCKYLLDKFDFNELKEHK